MKSTMQMLVAETGWENPFGDGYTGYRIIHGIVES